MNRLQTREDIQMSVLQCIKWIYDLTRAISDCGEYTPPPYSSFVTGKRDVWLYKISGTPWLCTSKRFRDKV